MALNRVDPAVETDLDFGFGAFVLEELQDLLGALIAEELSELLLMPLDSVALHEGKELGGRVPGEGRLHEVWAARGDVVDRSGANVGEVAASTAGDENLVPEPRVVFEDDHLSSPQPGGPGTEQSGSTSAHDDHI